MSWAASKAVGLRAWALRALLVGSELSTCSIRLISGISAALPFQLEAGEMVEIEIADSMLYGHVIYSRPDDALFRAGIGASFIAMALRARRRSRCTTPVTGSLRFTARYLR
jgi:hypothetical protein